MSHLIAYQATSEVENVEALDEILTDALTEAQIEAARKLLFGSGCRHTATALKALVVACCREFELADENDDETTRAIMNCAETVARLEADRV